MKKEKRVWAIFLIALGWLTPNLTKAQQDSIKSYNLNEVVVTATKFPKSTGETGKVLTIIDSEQLQRSAGKDLSQLLNEQVGLVINGANSNPGKDKAVYLRGAKSNYTLFLLDGIPVNDPSGSGGAFDPRLLPLDQLERIEILKGSQSTLYGSDAIAGVINLITKKDGDKVIGGSAILAYGSYDTFKGSGVVNGSTKIVDYNLGYSYFRTTGISEAEDQNNIMDFDKDGFNRNTFNASARFKITSGLTLTPFFRLTDYDGKYDGGSFTDGNFTYTSKFINPGISSQYKFGKGTINFLYGYNRIDRKFGDPFRSTEFKGRFNNADLFFNYSILEELQVLAGFNVQHLKMPDTTLSVANPDANLMSPYVSLFLHDIRGFVLEVGGRYNNHSKYGSNFTYSFNPSYTINSHIKLFINQSSGFKAPTLSQLYGRFGANEDLKPEKSNSSEAGIQLITSDRRLDVRVAVFTRNVKDAITYTNEYINLDQQDDFGFEIESSFRVNEKVNIKAFYAFIDGEVTTTTENGIDSTYYNLIRRPKHSVGANVGVQINDGLYVSANIKTFSKRTDLFFNPDNFYTAEQVSLDSYILFDIYAEYKILDDRLKFFLDAKNLLNQNYTEVYGYNTLGINLNTGLSFSF